LQSTSALRSRAVGGKSMWRSDEIDQCALKGDDVEAVT